MRLFRRGKKESEPGADGVQIADPNSGMARLLRDMTEKAEAELAKFVSAHLERIHEPGGYEREKREVSDFMDLGMGRTYLEALDQVEFSAGETFMLSQLRGKGGRADVVTRWTVRGVHSRPLAGLEPSGEEITIDGVTISSIRDFRLRTEYSFWQTPELTRKYLGA
jgi:hypothetical protein